MAFVNPSAVFTTLRAGACVMALAACNRASPPSQPAAHLLHQLAAADGSIAWHGALECADCDGIDAQLVLRRAGQVNDYTLVETYRVADQGMRFVEHGRWRRSADLLHMDGDGGAIRVYALMDDGRLQARDSHGRALPGRPDDALVPVTASSAP